MRYKDKNGNSWSYTNGIGLILIPLVIFVLFVNSVFGQEYPQSINLDDVLTENYTPPTELPDYLEPYTNRYGNTVTRVSDVVVFGTNSQRLAHNYSKDQAWNSDGTLIKLASKPAAILNGSTYEFLYWAENIVSYARWSNLEPNIMYGTGQNNLYRYNVTTDTREVIYTFPFNVDFGYGEGNLSHNDKYIGLISSQYLIVFNLYENTFSLIDKPSGDLDWFTVTPSGRFAVAQWRNDGNGSNEGMKLYDIDLTNERHIADYTGHGDFLQLSNGQEVFIQFGNQPQWDNECSLEMINLDTEVNTNVFYWSQAIHGNSGIWGGHISTTYNVKDWVFISEGCCYNHGTLPSENFAYNPLTNEIRRYGKNHSRAQVGYTHEARGSVNRDATKMIFASNYFQPEVESLNSALAFIVEVPQPTLSVTQFEYVLKPLKTEYYNLLGQKINKPLKGVIFIQIDTYDNTVTSRKMITW